MSLAQMRLVSAAHKHGAKHAGASAMRGYARFPESKDAEVFASLMLMQQWSVLVYQLGNLTAVDWTADRMPNGQITAIRSESKA